MKLFVAVFLALASVCSNVEAATTADLEQIRDSSVLAYGNVESAGAYLRERNYGQQVTDGVASLSTLNSLATIALPPYNYPVHEEIVYYDNHPTLNNIVSLAQTYGPGAPADVRVYLENAYRYTTDTLYALRRVAHP